MRDTVVVAAAATFVAPTSSQLRSEHKERLTDWLTLLMNRTGTGYTNDERSLVATGAQALRG